jgi:hypothetical protein
VRLGSNLGDFHAAGFEPVDEVYIGRNLGPSGLEVIAAGRSDELGKSGRRAGSLVGSETDVGVGGCCGSEPV